MTIGATHDWLTPRVSIGRSLEGRPLSDVSRELRVPGAAGAGHNASEHSPAGSDHGGRFPESSDKALQGDFVWAS